MWSLLCVILKYVLNVWYCGKRYMIENLPFWSFLNVQFSDIKHVHAVCRNHHQNFFHLPTLDTLLCVTRISIKTLGGEEEQEKEKPPQSDNFFLARGAPGWLSYLSLQLQLRSWSHSWWAPTPHKAHCCQPVSLQLASDPLSPSLCSSPACAHPKINK